MNSLSKNFGMSGWRLGYAIGNPALINQMRKANQHIITCFIEDEFGLRNLDFINVDKVTWECDYPHSDSTWPNLISGPKICGGCGCTRPTST